MDDPATDPAGATNPGARRSLATRAVWNVVDQVLSSATNAALSFLVARSVGESAFGAFVIAFTVFALLVGVSRAVSTSPLGIRFADADVGAFRTASGSAAGTAVALGAVGGLGCVVAGLVFPDPLGTALLAVGVVLPGLLLQDAWRYVFFAAGRPAAAALNDAFWAVLQIGAVVALLWGEMQDAAVLILAWGVSAAAAAVLGARQARARPQLRGSARWLRAHRNLTGFQLAEFGTLQGCQQGALLVIAAVGSLEAVGSLRAVQVLLGPTTILAVAALAFAVPEIARRRSVLEARQYLAVAAGLGLLVAVLGLAWGSFFLLLPDTVGAFLLGDTWPGTEEILVPTVVGQFAGASGIGPVAVLLALDRASVTFAVNVVEGILIFVGGIVGVLVAGAYGAAWGLGLPFWLILPLLWFRLNREITRRHP